MFWKTRKKPALSVQNKPRNRKLKDRVRYLFWSYGRYLDDRFGPLNSDLLEAAEHGYAWAIEPLLKKKTVNVNTRGKDGDTPLILAVRENDFECCRLLLEAGADPFAKNEHGTTAMAIAMRRNRAKINQLFSGFVEAWLVKSFGEDARPFYGLFSECLAA